MALTWHRRGIDMALTRDSLAFTWHSHGIHMAFTWHSHDIDMALIGTGIAVIEH